MKIFNPDDRLKLHPKSTKTLESFWLNNFDFIKTFDYIIIGKPFGCNPILESFNIKQYTKVGIEHDLIPEIHYSEYTLGNSLGIAEGISISEPSKSIFVLLSDAQLNMGSILEALKSIPCLCTNITVFIDLNLSGSRGPLKFINDLNFEGWNVHFLNCDETFNNKKGLNLVYFKTSELVE